MSRSVRLLICAVLLSSFAAPTQAAIPPTERNALVALYNSTGGPQWTSSQNWLGPMGTECSWEGVECNDAGTTVIDITLASNNLTGFIPSEIGDLPNLVFLYLGENSIGGTIPTRIGLLTKLEELYLQRNRISGTIPSAIGDLQSLKQLHIFENRLTGSIPGDIGKLSNLEQLLAFTNELTGSLPVQLAQLSLLEVLSLDGNQIGGTIPPQLGSMPNLRFVFLQGNKLQGQIPKELGNLTKLEELNLGENMLTGPIPPELGNLPELRNLFLSNNALTTLPPELFRAPKLETLAINNAAITGSIPREIGQAKQLKHLGLEQNQLTGSIPVEIGSLPNLITLDLFFNKLTGPIPPELGNLSQLNELSLNFNQLSGSIPSELGKLSNLTILSLTQNQLTGTIPTELTNLTNLAILSLSENQLTGTIPAGITKLTKLFGLYLNDNRLSGSLPNLSALVDLEELYLYTNELGGDLFSSLGRPPKLRQLLVDSNFFTGTIPADIASMPLTYVTASFNLLEGTIPPQIGDLANLEILQIENNRLSGTIPTEIGKLTKITDLRFGSNDLTGVIPPQIGNLKELTFLSLSENHLEGSLPRELGQLTKMEYLSLGINKFTGTIPAELGNLNRLLQLYISYNALVGPIPDSLLNLTSLENNASEIKFNALFTSNAALRDFLDQKEAGDESWQVSQTVPPTNVAVAAVTADTAVVTWTRIGPSFDSGGYEVYVSTSPGGAPVQVVTTESKVDTSAYIDELNPLTKYYFTVRTVTYPDFPQQNFIRSGPTAEVSATTTADVPSPAQVVITYVGFGLVQDQNVGGAQDFFVVTNFGDAATTVTMTKSGTFFNIDPQSSFLLQPGADQTVAITGLAVPAGAYNGEIVLTGTGVTANNRVQVDLLSVAPPGGRVEADANTNRIDLTAPVEIDPSGTAIFTNVGDATLSGILVSNASWLVPEPGLITIPPGQSRTINFTIDRELRPDAASLTGTVEGTLALLYATGRTTTREMLTRTPHQGTPVLATPITVTDTVKPAVQGSAIPPIGVDEIALFVPGVGHVVGGVGTFLSDLSVSNSFGVGGIADLKLYYLPSMEYQINTPATSNSPALPPRGTFKLADVVKNVFGSDSQVGTLQLRARDARDLSVSANIFNISNPAGTYGTVIPVFRSNRALAPGVTGFITGLTKSPTTRTNMFVQEMSGVDGSFRLEFLAPGGTVLSRVEDTVRSFSLRRLIDVVPAGAVSARLTNTSSSARISAYATPVDQASGDFWSVADWNQEFAYLRTDPTLIPIAGNALGANDTFFRTDASIFNPGTSSAVAEVRYFPRGGATMQKTVTVEAGSSAVFSDIVGTLFGAAGTLGYMTVTPQRGSLSISTRTFATVGSLPGTYGSATPSIDLGDALRLGQSRVIGSLEVASLKTIGEQRGGTFRTNLGFIEIDGRPVTVRVTVLYGDSRALAYGPITSFDIPLQGREFLLLTDLSSRLQSISRGEDLRNVSLLFQIVNGEGGVSIFTSSVDNGTGDSIFRIE